jgi:FkbM family methyltransferase
MHRIRSLFKPHYLFRPSQLVARAKFALSGRWGASQVTVELPWKLRLHCRPTDGIGAALIKLGVFELHVSEAIWRLLDQGEIAIDAGANIGYMSSLMAKCIGPSGRLISIEPHPEIVQELRANVAEWSAAQSAPVDVREVALSDESGEGSLVIPEYFASNRGTASLAAADHVIAATGQYVVQVRRLDDLISQLVPEQNLGLLKIDVEWHEAAVLRGAEKTLKSGRIRDVVYEDHRGPGSEASRLLRSWGFRVFAIRSSFFGPRLSDCSPTVPAVTPTSSPDFLATRDPERALERFGPRGWRVLGSQN